MLLFPVDDMPAVFLMDMVPDSASGSMSFMTVRSGFASQMGCVCELFFGFHINLES